MAFSLALHNRLVEFVSSRSVQRAGLIFFKGSLSFFIVFILLPNYDFTVHFEMHI